MEKKKKSIDKAKTKPKLKILASGDIHGDTSLAEKLAERAKKENVDLVILCGDLTMGERSTSNLIGPFVKRKKKVILIPIIVTWFDDAVFFHNKVPVVPFSKLRSFFRDFYLYIEDIIQLKID